MDREEKRPTKTSRKCSTESSTLKNIPRTFYSVNDIGAHTCNGQIESPTKVFYRKFYNENTRLKFCAKSLIFDNG